MLPPSNSASTACGRRGQGSGAHHPLRDLTAQRAPTLDEVLDLGGVRARVVVRRVLELGVRDRQLDAVPEHAKLHLRQLLGLVRDVAGLHARAQGPALHRLGQDDRRRALVLGRGLVRRVELSIIVATPAQLGEVVVGQVLHELAQPGIRTEEVLADVGTAGDAELLELAVQRLVHLLHEHAVHVAGEQVVPLASPDDLDHVPAGAAEHRFQFLDDLAVPADRSVQPLEVAVDDERQVVEALASGEVERAERLRLVRLPVTQERPDARSARVQQSAVLEIAVEARLVDRGDGPDAHGHRGVLPEVGHQPRVRVGAQSALPRDGLATEMVQLILGEPTLQERPRVDARCGVALVEDLVAGPFPVLAPEEVVEPCFVQARRARVGREVAADAREARVRPEDHRDRVPTHDAPDPQLHRLVTREGGLLLRADRVDVAGLGQRGKADLQLAGAFEQLVDQEPRAGLARLLHHLVERLHPVVGLGGIDVRELVLELVEVHAGVGLHAGAGGRVAKA